MQVYEDISGMPHYRLSVFFPKDIDRTDFTDRMEKIAEHFGYEPLHEWRRDFEEKLFNNGILHLVKKRHGESDEKYLIFPISIKIYELTCDKNGETYSSPGADVLIGIPEHEATGFSIANRKLRVSLVNARKYARRFGWRIRIIERPHAPSGEFEL
jgi:hypothetical protein